MYFEWNEAKNKLNIRKHGIDFTDAKQIFTKPMLVMLDARENYGEERWIGIGMMKELVTVVVYVEIMGDRIRLISARKATKYERQRYEQIVKN